VFWVLRSTQTPNTIILNPKPNKPVVAKRKSRFIGEMNIDD
jgi:hypothetical protein